MKILITGAAGFVGKGLCKILTASGHEVLALVHPDSVERAGHDLAGAQLLPADLASLRAADLPSRADAVFSLAQARRFREFPRMAQEVFAVNVQATLTLLHWALSVGVQRFIHVSSGGVHGGGRESSLCETDLLAMHSPLGFYLGTKLCSEVIFQNYRHFFRTAVTLRPFFIYGPGQRKDMFVARLIESIRNGTPVQLQGENGLRMNPIFVEDASAAIARALHLEGPHIINLAGPEVLTLRALCEIIGRAVGRAPIYERKEGPPVDYVADISQLTSKLLAPVTPIAEGIGRAVSG